jgi:hypothetical protein
MNGRCLVWGQNQLAQLLLVISTAALFVDFSSASSPLITLNNRPTNSFQNGLSVRGAQRPPDSPGDVHGDMPLQCTLSPAGCFPIYFIIGSPKSGTSSLWEFIAQYEKQYMHSHDLRTSPTERLTVSHNVSIPPPCALPRLKEPRFWTAAKHSEDRVGYYLVHKYLPKYKYDPRMCHSSSFVDATPTYLGIQ